MVNGPSATPPNPADLQVTKTGAPSTVAGTYQPPVDFALATSVKTTTHIDDPRTVRFLRVRISIRSSSL